MFMVTKSNAIFPLIFLFFTSKLSLEKDQENLTLCLQSRAQSQGKSLWSTRAFLGLSEPFWNADYITCPECLRVFKQRQIIYTGVCVYAYVCSVTHLSLCDPIDCSPPGSSVHGILQARILEGVAISSSRGSSWPRDQNCISCVSCIGRQTLYHWATWEAHIQSWPWNKSGMKESTQMQSRICQFIRYVKSFIYTKHRVFERSSGHWKKGHSCNLFHIEFCLNIF